MLIPMYRLVRPWATGLKRYAMEKQQKCDGQG